nr:MAG TPA: hypothetical protein [Caudoviricetes sp.]
MSPFPKVLEELRRVSNFDYPKSTLNYSCGVFQLLTVFIYSSSVLYPHHVLKSSYPKPYRKVVPR